MDCESTDGSLHVGRFLAAYVEYSNVKLEAGKTFEDLVNSKLSCGHSVALGAAELQEAELNVYHGYVFAHLLDYGWRERWEEDLSLGLQADCIVTMIMVEEDGRAYHRRCDEYESLVAQHGLRAGFSLFGSTLLTDVRTGLAVTALLCSGW